MNFKTKSIIGCILAGILVSTPGYSAPFTEEYFSQNIYNDDKIGPMLKEIKAMSVKDREETTRSALKLIEKLYKKRDSHKNLNSSYGYPDLDRLISILPVMGLPDEVAAHLAPMIDCEDTRIRSIAFQAITELDQGAGLDIVASRMKYLISRFPSADVLGAPMPDEEVRQMSVDIISALYGMKALLLAHSNEKRKLGNR